MPLLRRLFFAGLLGSRPVVAQVAQPLESPELVRQWIAAQLTAEAALRSSRPSPYGVDPSAVVVHRIDSVAPGTHIVRLAVIGFGHGLELSVLSVNGVLFRMAGFREPQVIDAWAALSRSVPLGCDALQLLIAQALDPNGGVEVLAWRDGKRDGRSPQGYSVLPSNWPQDTTLPLAGGSHVSITTYLSRRRVDYPHPSYMPVAYALVLSQDCRLKGWSALLGAGADRPHDSPRK
jgi:hypothetical protein